MYLFTKNFVLRILRHSPWINISDFSNNGLFKVCYVIVYRLFWTWHRLLR